MDTQKRKKPYVNHFNNKKSKQLTLECGMIGFLCTCNFKEKECIKDAYKLLEKFDDSNINDSEKNPTVDESKNSSDNKDASDDHQDQGDISDELKNEINQINQQTPLETNKFQYVDTGVKNVIFINTTIPDPLKLASTIFKDVAESKRSLSRFLLRFIPVQLICKAYMNDIKSHANELFEKYFAQEPVSFAIVFNRRYNNTIQRTEVIETLASIIQEKNPGNKANLKNPDIAVVVEIIKSFCLISIAPDYFKYRKYNLYELCNKKDNLSSTEKVTE